MSLLLLFSPGVPALPASSTSVSLIPVVNNLEQLRKQANAILAALQSLLPGYGPTLPDVAAQPDGRLFINTADQTLYQVQAGAWVAVDMVP